MTFMASEFSRLEGFIIANQILEHSCGWCRVPFLNCKGQRVRSRNLDKISKKLDAHRRENEH